MLSTVNLYIVLAVIAAIAGVYFYGYTSGRSAGQVRQLEEIVKAERERQGIDDRIQNLDDYHLCLRLVRVPDTCEQLRGVAETPANK